MGFYGPSTPYVPYENPDSTFPSYEVWVEYHKDRLDDRDRYDDPPHIGVDWGIERNRREMYDLLKGVHDRCGFPAPVLPDLPTSP